MVSSAPGNRGKSGKIGKNLGILFVCGKPRKTKVFSLSGENRKSERGKSDDFKYCI